MKRFLLPIVFIFSGLTSLAQTNTFPSTGFAGIGTIAPTVPLEVRGNALIAGKMISSLSGDIGGHIELRNPAKTATGIASSWQIFNMTGTYGNSLQFWAYDDLGCASGGMCTSRVTFMDNGNVGIGMSTPSDKLSVNGKIRAKEVKVEATGWPDFVFAKDYVLPTLRETEKHIQDKGHLPGIPSAEEVAKDGIDLGEMNRKLLQKIEELTLHLIEQNKEIKALRKEMEVLQENIK